jgi:protein-S-isoprenylcysteine O-methyltransferase Ste14
VGIYPSVKDNSRRLRKNHTAVPVLFIPGAAGDHKEGFMKKTDRKKRSEVKKHVIRRMVQIAAQQLVIYASLFISAGSLKWVWAWVLVVCALLIITVNAMVLPPELIAERGRIKPDTKKWDKLISMLSLIPSLGIFILAGLDFRFKWSGVMDSGLHFFGLLLFLLGSGLFTWAMVHNRFFSSLVRIQFDRHHQVAAGGPYRFVRHPGYVGFILFNLGLPFLLGSVWAFVCAGVLSVLFVIRTSLEDRTLQKELKGYRPYSRKVKFRLIPGIW